MTTTERGQIVRRIARLAFQEGAHDVEVAFLVVATESYRTAEERCAGLAAVEDILGLIAADDDEAETFLRDLAQELEAEQDAQDDDYARTAPVWPCR